MSTVNDENARPNVRPSDSDRARFGFLKDESRLSQGKRSISSRRLSQAGSRQDVTENVDSPSLRREPEEELASGGCREAGIIQATLSEPGAVSVELVSLLEKTFGDSTSVNELLRAKSQAKKYDFKARMAELYEQNRALKAALADRLHRERCLAEDIAGVQADLAWRLRAATSDASGARRELDERGKLLSAVQDALRMVWREQAAANSAGQEADDPSERMALRAEVVKAELRAVKAEARSRLASRLVEECGDVLKAQGQASDLRHRALEEELKAAHSRIIDMEAELNDASPLRSFASPGGVHTGAESAAPTPSQE